MAGEKSCSTGVLDSIFNFLSTSTMRFIVMTSSGPAAGIVAASSPSSAYCLAQATVGGFPTTDYLTYGSSGLNRYMTIAACSCDIVRWTGIAACVAIVNPATMINYVTTCTTQTLTQGNLVNIGTWTITVNQPT